MKRIEAIINPFQMEGTIRIRAGEGGPAALRAHRFPTP